MQTKAGKLTQRKKQLDNYLANFKAIVGGKERALSDLLDQIGEEWQVTAGLSHL